MNLLAKSTLPILALAIMSGPTFAASMDDNLRTATLTILASRHCKNVNRNKVKFIIASATNDAERHGIPGGEFMAEVAQKVADLSGWFKKEKTACSSYGFLIR